MRLNRYEMLVMIDVGLPDERIDQIIGKIEDMIKEAEGGEILTLDRWGKKRLAYEIKKRQFGYYVLYEFIAPSDLPREIDRYCRIEPDVMRHMILVIPDKVIKLKEKEEQLKVAMEMRRKEAAAKADNKGVVEDLLEKEDDDFESDDSDDLDTAPDEDEEEEA